MENTHSDQQIFDIGFDENVKQQLKGAAKWGGMAAILSLSGALLSLIAFFVVKPKTNPLGIESSPDAEMLQAAKTGGFVSMIFSLVIGVILFYLLNKFSRSVSKGLEGNDNYFIHEGLGSLSAYFKLIGILLIVVLVIVGLAFLVGIGSKV
jgi:hypothetical protein